MKTKKKANNLFFALLLLVLTASCTSNDVYFQFQSVSTNGWNKDSLYTFNVNIADTAASYNVYINIRNRSEYPYQNFWIFLHQNTPDSIQVSDSVECYLADQRGKWLGSGTGSVYEMPILYQQNKRFKKAGVYCYQIAQGMRDTLLVGINDIGLRVEKIVK